MRVEWINDKDCLCWNTLPKNEAYELFKHLCQSGMKNIVIKNSYSGKVILVP